MNVWSLTLGNVKAVVVALTPNSAREEANMPGAEVMALGEASSRFWKNEVIVKCTNAE